MSNSSIWLRGGYIWSYHSGLDNGNEGVFYIFQSFKTGALSSDYLVLYPRYSLRGVGVLTLSRNAIVVFYTRKPTTLRALDQLSLVQDLNYEASNISLLFWLLILKTVAVSSAEK